MGGVAEPADGSPVRSPTHVRDASIIVGVTLVGALALVLVKDTTFLAVLVAAGWGLVVGAVIAGGGGFPRIAGPDLFVEMVHLEVTRARRSETPLTAAAIAWSGGAQASRRLAARIRQTDTLARFGAEVRLLLPATSAREARALLERIVPESAPVVRTVSFPSDVLTAAALLDALDGSEAVDLADHPDELPRTGG